MDFLKSIAQTRLINQQIVGSSFENPAKLVSWMGAMQAQDYSNSKWAVGIRVPDCTDDLVEAAINSGKIIRTHILRPTWHLVAAEDVRWMMALTATNIDKLMASSNRQLELDDQVIKNSQSIIYRALEGGKEFTRKEIVDELTANGIVTDSRRASHLVMKAEIDMVVCNGARRGKSFTYALFDEKIPSSKPLLKEEALAKLARKYFASHGPATLKDFIWWSGLSVADAKSALEYVRKDFASETIGSEIYYLNGTMARSKDIEQAFHLLPAFDELIISYKDRTASVADVDRSKAFTNNGIFYPLIVKGGQALGTWKRKFQKGEVKVEFNAFSQISDNYETPLKREIDRLNTFYTLE